jgi:predicted transcriptional regulator
LAAERRVSDARPVWYFRGMGSGRLKQKIVETVEHLPDDATVEDAMERLYFLAKIERGLAESEAGDTIPHEDVRKRFLG